MALPRLYAFTNTHTLASGQALPGDIYFSPDTGLITPNYTRSRPEISDHVTRIDLKGEYVVAPGYLEVQINGFAGVHFTNLGTGNVEGDQARLKLVARELAKRGVTGFLPTVPTVESRRWQEILPLLQPCTFSTGAAILGAHIEGPYLHPAKNGAHSAHFFLEPDKAPYQQLYGESNLRSVVKLITLAPELSGSIEMIKSLRQNYPSITISLGHSTATYDEGQEALRAGARGLTHLHNAMNSMHHRNPGLAGLIANNPSTDAPQETISSPSEHLLSSTMSVQDWLARQMAALSPSVGDSSNSKPEVFFTLIPDMVHLHPVSLTIAHRTSPHKSILISDAIELANMPDGTYPANGQITQPQVKKGNRVTIENTEILIGSCVAMDECVRNMMNHAGCTLAEAVRCVTENVANYLNQGDAVRGRGSLDIGCRADFVVLDRQGHVKQTWIGGTKIWDCDNPSIGEEDN